MHFAEHAGATDGGKNWNSTKIIINNNGFSNQFFESEHYEQLKLFFTIAHRYPAV